MAEETRIGISIEGDNKASQPIQEVGEQLERLDEQAKSTEQASNGLSKSFSGLRGVAERLRNALSGLTKEDWQRGFTAFGTTLKSQFPVLNSFIGTIRSVIGSLTRVAKMRLLRSAIKGLTKAFKEGISNIYQYSQAMNLAFANTMNSISTEYLYLKNTLGSLGAQVIQAIAPALQSVIGMLQTAADYVAQFIALITGKSVYTRAVKYATTYGGALEDSLGGASANAKELKNTLLGFDEINRLDDVSEPGGGGGAGGGSATPPYSEMFEEAPISDKVKKVFDFIKENLETIKALAIEIGSALLLWKIGKSVISFLSALMGWDAAKTAGIMSKLGKILAGITLVITGATIEYKGAFNLGKNGFNLKDLLQTIFGAGAVIGGGALIGSALGATGVGIAVAIPVALLIAISGYTEGKYQALKDAAFELDEAWQLASESIEISATHIQASQERVDGLKGAIDGLYQRFAEVGTAKMLIDNIFELGEKSNRTTEENNKLKEMIDTLNAMNLDGIYIEYDELTGQITTSKEEIYNQIEALEESVRRAAKLEIMQKAWESVYQSQIDMADAQERVNKLTEEFNSQDVSTYEYLNTMYSRLNPQQRLFVDKMNDLKKAIEDGEAEIEQLNSEYEYSCSTLENIDDIINQVNTDIDAQTESVDDATASTKEYGKKLSDLGTNARLGANGVKAEIGKLKTVGQAEGESIGGNLKRRMTDTFSGDGVKTKVAGFKDWGMAEGKGIGTNLKSGMESNFGTSGIKSAISGLSGYGKSVGEDIGDNIVAGIRASVSGVQLGVKQLEKGLASLTVNGYASGGIVTSGNLFMAQENGMPELVGRIGNQTAVANTGQMVDAMAAGVYMAMTRANSNQGTSNTEVNVYMDSERVAQAVDRGNRSLNRRYNVSLA